MKKYSMFIFLLGLILGFATIRGFFCNSRNYLPVWLMSRVDFLKSRLTDSFDPSIHAKTQMADRFIRDHSPKTEAEGAAYLAQNYENNPTIPHHLELAQKWYRKADVLSKIPNMYIKDIIRVELESAPLTVRGQVVSTESIDHLTSGNFLLLDCPITIEGQIFKMACIRNFYATDQDRLAKKEFEFIGEASLEPHQKFLVLTANISSRFNHLIP